jgi:hypothetical protein
MAEIPAFIEDDLELPIPSLSDQVDSEPLPGFDMDDPMLSDLIPPANGNLAQQGEPAFQPFGADMSLPPSDPDRSSQDPLASVSESSPAPAEAPASTIGNGFENNSSFDPTFGGSAESNPDSGKSDLEQRTNEELAAAKKALKDNDERLATLEKQLKEANAKLKAEQSKPRSSAIAATPKARAPAPRPSVAQQLPIAKAPAPRPSLCVAAVAQAARNCSTCVAHAFLTHQGQETMLGHGDFIEGYRVSISGDRLDLQTTSGEVVHKYWSSPDGCSRT